MIAGLHIGAELKRFFAGKLPPVALVMIVLLPLIFGGLFVWSYFDPIGGLSRLPVAVVNSDEGADTPDGFQKAGDEVTASLLKNDRVKFIETSAQEAKDGVADGTYYFAIELPEDFTAAATSVTSDNPRSATINTAFNNTNGFIATMLGTNVTREVVDTVDRELGAKVTGQLLVGFSTIGEGMDAAAEGSGKLHEGAGSAHDGAAKLADGAAKLADGTQSAHEGAAKLADGASKLDDGLGTAHNGAAQLAQGLAALDAATDRLGEGAGKVSGGVDTLVGGANQLNNQVTGLRDQVVAPLVNISAQLRALNLPQTIDLANQADQVIAQLNANPQDDLLGKLAQLSAGAAEIHRQLSDPNAEYRSGVDRASAASQKLEQGLSTLKEGSGKLVIGAQTLADGSSKLVDGSQQLSVGATQLRDGLVQLDAGSGELNLKISEGAKQVPRFPENIREAAARSASSPVEERLVAEEMTKFGVGLAPFFISLGLFMGGTVMFMLLHAIQRRAVDSGLNPLRVALATYIPALLIGFAQATVMWLVLTYLIGLAPDHKLGLWFAMLGISATFVAVTHGINALVGAAAGRVVCLIFMALQLVSSGGLYPPETQPAFLQWVHTWDPMTFSVNLLREMIVGSLPGPDHRMTQAIIVLGFVWVIALSVSTYSAWRDRIVKAKDLHPELAL